jgi:hypothetical protein
MNYLKALELAHAILQPRTYVEIGCRIGVSLSISSCSTIAVDPNFTIKRSLQAPTRLFRETSDEFFARRNLLQLNGGPFDLAFIDGLHHAEAALRDFINLERNAHANSIILIDDVLPADLAWTTREREGDYWTGDVYKMIPALRSRRNDLVIDVFDVEQKGLAVISQVNPSSTVLGSEYSAIESDLVGDRYKVGAMEELREMLRPIPVDELPGYLGKLAVARGLHAMNSQPQV